MNLMMNEYKTKDWNIAAMLISKGLHLIGVERNGVCWFRFKETEKAAALEQAFQFGDVQVDARAFIESQKRVKSLIHDNASFRGS